MSHNASGLPPHVVSFTPTSVTQTGTSTISVTGARLSATCELKIPAALGTVVSGPVLSAFSTTTATATWTINALAPPASPATRVCTVSNGGQENTGVAISFEHLIWTPDELVTSADCAWFKAEDVTDSNSNPVTNGSNMYYWQPAATTITSTVDKIRRRTGYSDGVYQSNVSSLNGKPAVLQGFEDVAGTIGNAGQGVWLPNGSSGWDFDPITQPFTIAVNMKQTPWGEANPGFNVSRWNMGNSNGDATELMALGDGTIQMDLGNSIPASPYRATVLSGQTVTGRSTYVFTGDGAASLTVRAWHNGNTATAALSGGSNWSWIDAQYWSAFYSVGWTTDILFLNYAMTPTQSGLLDSWFAVRYGS